MSRRSANAVALERSLHELGLFRGASGGRRNWGRSRNRRRRGNGRRRRYRRRRWRIACRRSLARALVHDIRGSVRASVILACAASLIPACSVYTPDLLPTEESLGSGGTSGSGGSAGMATTEFLECGGD